MRCPMPAILVSLSFALVGARSGATVIYRLTFDNTGTPGGPANASYTAASEDIVDMHQAITRYGTNPVPQIAVSTGPQGGGAFVTAAQLAGSAQGPGYTTDNTNNKAYFIHPVAGRGLTLEALFNATAWTKDGWGGMVNYNNEHFLGFSWGAANKPDLKFSVKSVGVITNVPPVSLCDGAWHHVAGVWTRNADGANGKLEIFLDGVSVTNRLIPIPAGDITIPTGGWGFSAEGYTVPPRLRSFIGKLDAAAVADEARSPGNFLLQENAASLIPDVYTEDFESGWTNGASGFTGGAFPGNWALRSSALGSWQVQDLGSPTYTALAYTNGSHNNGWWPIGGQYPLRVRPGQPVTVELSARMRLMCNATSGRSWKGWLYLMNRDLNGYGLCVTRGLNAPTYARVIKYRGSTAALGTSATGNWTESEGANATADTQVGATADEGFVRLHLRFEQDADGQPVTVKLWHTESGVPDSSKAFPDRTWLEDGTAFGGILNLRDLQWVGVNAEETSGVAPQNGPGAGVWWDDLRVELIRETGTVIAVE